MRLDVKVRGFFPGGYIRHVGRSGELADGIPLPAEANQEQDPRAARDCGSGQDGCEHD
jgi:hypothetical protein